MRTTTTVVSDHPVQKAIDMFSVQMQYPGVDPWVAAWQSSEHRHQVSRAAAVRYALMEAVRERRHASRPARRTPAPAQVEPVAQPGVVPHDTPARTEELTPVG